MVGTRKNDRWSLRLFAAAIVVGAGTTALTLAWIARTKSPDKILERCDGAMNQLQHRLDELQAA